MVCSVGTVASTGVVTVIPFINNYAAAGLSTELVNLAGATWGWLIRIVVGSDRNMFVVGF